MPLTPVFKGQLYMTVPGMALQAEGTAGAKALRQGPACSV